MNTNEFFAEVIPVLEKFAPSFAGALVGPYGTAALLALQVLAHTFDCDDGNMNDVRDKILTDHLAGDKLVEAEKCHGSVICGISKTLESLNGK